VAARSKACICGRLPAEIACSNPGGGMDVCLLWVLCVLSSRVLCDQLITRPEKSYQLWGCCVWSRNLKNEEAMADVGPQCHRTKMHTYIRRLAFWSCNSLIWKTTWGRQPGAETCRRLIFVINCVLLIAFVDCINYKQMHGTNNIKFMRDILLQNTHTLLFKQLIKLSNFRLTQF